MDGKTLRGSKRQGAQDAHLLAAFSHRLGVVLGQAGVPDKTNEIGAASAFLLTLVLEGRIVTADALLTQREVAQTILDGGGDYLLVGKETPPTLHADLVATFAPGADGTGLVGPACTVTQHGDRSEYRHLTASTALVGYSDWPGLQQALRIDRRAHHKGTGAVLRAETAYASTSAVPRRATPRGCWRCGAATGGSRTGCTTSAMSPSPRTAPPPAPSTPPRSWPPSATPPSASSTRWAPPRSPPPVACSPPSRSPRSSPSVPLPTLNSTFR